MSTRVDVEEIQTTKSEKLLAAVLVVFLLIGGIWAYQKLDDYVADAVAIEYSLPGSAGQRAASRLLAQAEAARAQARGELELSREAYRTALEAGAPAGELAAEYAQARTRFARADAQVHIREAELERTRPAAREAVRRAVADVQRRQDRRERLTFALRTTLVVLSALLGYWLLARLRRRGSRYFPLAMAVVVYAAILAFVLAAHYVTDYVDPVDLGPLFLALFGITATLLAFLVLERNLARRLPFRRVRKSECPFCGYPVRGNRFCEGCGRDVVAACTHCGRDRRVGTARCGSCGAA